MSSREELRHRIEAALDAAGCAPLLATRLSRVVMPVVDEELRLAADAESIPPWWGHLPKVFDPDAGGSVGEWLRSRVTPATTPPADREQAIKDAVIDTLPADSLAKKDKIRFCRTCGDVAEDEQCHICRNTIPPAERADITLRLAEARAIGRREGMAASWAALLADVRWVLDRQPSHEHDDGEDSCLLCVVTVRLRASLGGAA